MPSPRYVKSCPRSTSPHFCFPNSPRAATADCCSPGGLSTITIGGLIDRGDIYQAMQANPDLFGVDVATLNPDDLAETVWRLYTERAEAEAVINALAA
jgi:hypothetical protein